VFHVNALRVERTVPNRIKSNENFIVDIPSGMSFRKKALSA
jgi:hypothetical protein